VNEVITSLRRSAAADGTQPAGTIYFMKNSDIRARTREPLFPSAAAALAGTGLKGEIAEGVLPQGKSDVAGAMVGTSSFDWNASKSTMLPGAICENLTSFGGAMGESSGQTPLTEFIRHGAAGSSGTVTEPYAIQAKFPDAFLYVHYARGCSLAEAFYQSLSGPYQLLVVGDPLCQPWAKRPNLEVTGVTANQKVSGTITLVPRTSGPHASSTDRFALFVDGRRVMEQEGPKPITLDTTKLGDGWHELRVVAVAGGQIETQQRFFLPIVVDNAGKQASLGLAAPKVETVVHGTTATVEAASAGAASITIYHNMQSLGEIAGAKGVVHVNTQSLGLGIARLQAVAKVDGKPVHSPPLYLSVGPPMKLPAAGAKKLAAGLELRVAGAQPTVVADLKDKTWLSAAQVGAGKSFTLAGWFEVPADDMYQFQFRGNSAGQLHVDGIRLWPTDSAQPNAANWQAVPVYLAAGRHLLELHGTAAASPTLEVRFGGPGCRTLDGSRFQHEVP